jgi:hypothetical protein
MEKHRIIATHFGFENIIPHFTKQKRTGKLSESGNNTKETNTNVDAATSWSDAACAMNAENSDISIVSYVSH